MGLVWDLGESRAFQSSLAKNLEVWDAGARAWIVAIQNVTEMIGSGPNAQLSGSAWETAKTLYQDRLQPLAESAERCSAWTRRDLDEYLSAESVLSDPDMGSTHLDEDRMRLAVIGLEVQLAGLLSFEPPDWPIVPQGVRDGFNQAIFNLTSQIRAIRSQIEALQTFAQRVSGVFEDEILAAAAVKSGLDSISKGSISADGAYVPASGDAEAWRQQAADYLVAHAQVADTDAQVQLMLQQLRAQGLLTGDPDATYLQWLANAARAGVSPQTICDIVKQLGITPSSFAVLAPLTRVTDPDGKVFFVMPSGVDAATAQQIVLMAYIFNARTDYGLADDPRNKLDSAKTKDSMAEVLYGVGEIARIKARIAANAKSYTDLLPLILGGGGQVAATPNGMMMAVTQAPSRGGGLVKSALNAALAQLSQGGGTTHGDVFVVNIDGTHAPGITLKNIISLGSIPDTGDPTGLTRGAYPGIGPDGGSGTIDLDRLLHHEQLHAQQWADGHGWFAPAYLIQQVLGHAYEKNPFEQDAGLADGGYQAPR